MREASDLWDGRTLMVTGGAGFLGSHLIDELESRSNGVNIFDPRSDEYDLRKAEAIQRAFEDSGADTVIHLADTVDGIGGNAANPGQYFYDNAIIGIELIEQACQYGVEKTTILGPSAPIPSTRRCSSAKRTSLTVIPKRPTLPTVSLKRLY